MITIRDVHKTFGVQTLLENAFLQINDGERFALVGPNGAGKSTLFKMLLGEVEPDGGDIQVRRGATVGYLPQENAPVTDGTVLNETLKDHDDPDGHVTAKAKMILAGLGFKNSDFDRPVNTFSGGWAMRVAMARLLIQEPDLLLLDEPTNHLDLESMIWFQEYLLNYPGAIFMVSHDRAFINTICQSIVSLQHHTLKVYRGNYEDFVREREAERQRLEVAYREQQDEIEQMKDFIARNRVRASTASRAQSMMKRLEKLDRIELPSDSKIVKIKFPQPERAGVRVLSLRNISKSYGPIQVYKDLNLEIERGWKIAFLGHNGAGKSTLLKMLAEVIPKDSGEIVHGHNVKIGYFSQHRTENLDFSKTVLEEAMNAAHRNVSDQSVRDVLGTFLFPGESVHKKISVLSGGEKSRIALVKLLLDPPNVLLLDEPTTHLDLASVDALIRALKEFDGTICLISHDLHFINSLASHVLHVEGGKATFYPGNYEYFQSRIRMREAETDAAPAPASVDENGEKKENSRKAERQKRAEERRVLSENRAAEHAKLKMREKNQKMITEKKARIEELGKKMSDPAIYSDFAEVKRLGDEIHTLQSEINALEDPA